jgi:hypothetical protein
VAAGAILIVGRIAYTDGSFVLAEGVGRLPVGAEILEARGIHRLRHNITVRQHLRGCRGNTKSG